MRKDSEGFMWTTPPKYKPTKPDPVWLEPTYLPGLEEALRFPVELMSDTELLQSAGDTFIYDCEVYPNYFLAAFRSKTTGKILIFESPNLNTAKLQWVMENFLLVGFNSIKFDLPIVSLACAGATTQQIAQGSDMLINAQERPANMLRHFKAKPLTVNQIDLIEVAPLDGSLKLYAARLHCQKMQDLPFVPNTNLTADQIAIIRWYCCNDLANTDLLHNALIPDLDLRGQLSTDYQMDLRSKSDAQIAEAVITHEVTTLNRVRPKRPEVDIGKKHHYKVPHFISYQTPMLNRVLDVVRASPFVVSETGGIELPKAISELKISIAGGTYQMGIGGLHSTEKSCFHKSDENYVLLDRDVASYYPAIIINQGLYPAHLGSNFGVVYRSLRDRRIVAKKAKQSRIAGSLKITVNGGFGKLGSKWSMLYSPELLIQVTITGQLALLMLIEVIELNGIHVVSGNTDGIVIKCPREREQELATIIKWWEDRTAFETEETRYTAVYSRDVNNYIAIKEDGKTKGKGVFANPWREGDKTQQLMKNPHNIVCVEAVTDFLAKGIPVDHTIHNCKDFSKFVCVQNVKGGAVKDGVYLGKTIRWYYARNCTGIIVRATNGYSVPCTEGARPVMDLPKENPCDIDHDWYIAEALEMLKGLGFTPGQ